MKTSKLILFVLFSAVGQIIGMEPPAQQDEGRMVKGLTPFVKLFDGFRDRIRVSDERSAKQLDELESISFGRDAARQATTKFWHDLMSEIQLLGEKAKSLVEKQQKNELTDSEKIELGQLPQKIKELEALARSRPESERNENLDYDRREREAIDAWIQNNYETIRFVLEILTLPLIPGALLRGFLEMRAPIRPGDSDSPVFPEQTLYRDVCIGSRSETIRIPRRFGLRVLLAGNETIPPLLRYALMWRLVIQDDLDFDILRVLIDLGAQVNQIWRGETALGWLINIQPDRYESFGDHDGVEAVIDAIDLLLELGADIDNVNSRKQAALKVGQEVLKRLKTEAGQIQDLEQRSLHSRVIANYERIVAALERKEYEEDRAPISPFTPSISVRSSDARTCIQS